MFHLLPWMINKYIVYLQAENLARRTLTYHLYLNVYMYVYMYLSSVDARPTGDQ